jgi:hypothetical protein
MAQRYMWCIPQVDGNYVACMEDVLDLYAEAPDAARPVMCFDESPTQLIGEVRAPIPAKPGQRERYDCQYRRKGTVNLFVFLDAHRPWRKVKVTESRAACDFAHCMRDLVDTHYPQAELIRVVLDNLSTHARGALYQAFPAPGAHRLLRRLEFHYTPKHASWLNMVEIEIGVLRGQCLDRRLPQLEYPLHDREHLVTACGRICMHRKKINISTVLAGQKVGIKEVDEGVWLVSFMHYDLGCIDLEQRTLQPLDNPFGSRLSPMS